MVIVRKKMWTFKEVKEKYPQLTGYMGCFSLGFLSAFGAITPEISPFGVAMVGAMEEDVVLPAAIGAGLGYLFSPTGMYNVQYLAAMVLLLCFRWAISVADPKIIRLVSPVLSSVAVGIPATMIGFTQGMSLYVALLIVAQSITTLAVGYIFSIGLHQLCYGHLGKVGVIALSITSILLFSGFLSLKIGQLSLGRVVLTIGLMAMSHYYGVGLSAIAACFGVAVLFLGNMAYLALPLVLGTTISTTFRGLHKGFTALSFYGVALATGYLLNNPLTYTETLIETTLSTLLFLLLPGKVFGFLEWTVTKPTTDPNVLSIAIAKLQETATALKEVAVLTGQINSCIGKMKGEEGENIYNKTAEHLCKGCYNAPHCWQSHFNDTMDCLEKMVAHIKGGRPLGAENIPPYFVEQCVKLPQMMDTLTGLTLGYMGRYEMKQQLSCIRSVVTDQFEGVATLLETTAEEMEDVRVVSPELASDIGNALKEKDFTVLWTGCYADGSGLKTIMVKIPLGELEALERLNFEEEVGRLFGEEVTKGRVVKEWDTATLIYYPKPTYTIDVEGIQRAAGDGRWCGDNYTTTTIEGSALVALSDGMGIGGEAAVDSMMTTTLLSRLYNARVMPEASLQLINGALLAKEGEERLATVDCLVVNLYDGLTTFYKAGAAPSFVIRGGKVQRVSGTALPAGILGEVSFAKSTFHLSLGDTVIMVSDGLTDRGEEWLISEINMVKDKPLKELTKHLLDTGKARCIGGHEDDMSVVGVRIFSATA